MTLAVIGQALVLIALLGAVGGVVLAALTSRVHWAGNASLRATTVAAAGAFGAMLVLIVSLMQRDYAIAYVASHVNDALPLQYVVSASWAGQEGSLLMWLCVLLAFALVLRRAMRTRLAPTTVIAANATMLFIAAFFAVLVTVPAPPFAAAETLVADGRGMTPALQNYWMAIHPPVLYAGYVGLAAPFAIIMGALITGVRGRRSWTPVLALTRVFALVAWCALGAGLLLGMRWAYEEIGWGGYWAWDPVENAALMPWLITTALVHSITVQQRRGMLRMWNVVLVAGAFALSIFGTFLTRSGILSSVHSFVESGIGWYFLGLVAAVLFASAVLIVWRAPLLRSTVDLDAVVSRETVFLLNNVLLVSIALTVLWGVLYPIISSTFGTMRIALQSAYYDFFLLVFGLPLLMLLGVAPFIAWRRARPRTVARRAMWPLAVGVVAGVCTVAFDIATSAVDAAAFSLGVFVAAGAIAELVRAARAQRRRAGGGRVRSLVDAIAGNRRRYGGYIAHLGVGLLVVGVVGSSAWTLTAEGTIAPGDRVRAGAWQLTYKNVERTSTANEMKVRAVFDVTRNGRDYGTVKAGGNFYPALDERTTEVAIAPWPFTGEDLYVIVDRLVADGTADVKVIVNPLVDAVWLGGIFIVLGGLCALIPSTPTRRRRSPGQQRQGRSGATRRSSQRREPAPAPTAPVQ